MAGRSVSPVYAGVPAPLGTRRSNMTLPDDDMGRHSPAQAAARELNARNVGATAFDRSRGSNDPRLRQKHIYFREKLGSAILRKSGHLKSYATI